MKNKIRIILWVIVFILIAIQFFPINKSNPPINPPQDFIQFTSPPMAVKQLLEVACYDCHAHTTKYPWYTNIQPVGWWVKKHIDNGRAELNFSTWTTYTDKEKTHILEECVEVLERKEMPLLSYMVAHQEAWLDEKQRKALVDWFKSIQ